MGDDTIKIRTGRDQHREHQAVDASTSEPKMDDPKPEPMTSNDAMSFDDKPSFETATVTPTPGQTFGPTTPVSASDHDFGHLATSTDQ